MAVTPSTKVDCEFTVLRAGGYTGALKDMELQWLQANGATSDDLSDAWEEFLVVQLGVAATGNRMDDEMAYYKSVISGGDQTTYGQSLPDLRRTFWCGGYAPP